MHGPRQSSEEYNFLKDYTKKCSSRHTHKDKQGRSGGNKYAKTVKFEDVTQEVNIMKSHDKPIPKK